MLIGFPACMSGCIPEGGTSAGDTDTGNEAGCSFVLSKSIDYETVGELDIFIFDDSPMGRLDSYQKAILDVEEEQVVEVSSRKGRKRIVFIANSHRSAGEWMHVNSYRGLQEEKASLFEEDISRPTMYGETVFEAGKDIGHRIILRPLVSEIHLRTIRCDFSGTEYAGEKLKDIKVYLTNVNAECRIMQDNGFYPELIVNAGGLASDDLRNFAHPELVSRRIGTDVGYEIFDSAIRLYCYPNESRKETAGTPFTRLVIEASVGENIWYYPIPVNRDGNGSGVGRNCSYVFNITILRAGATDPDSDVDPENIIIDSRILPWEERNEEEIIF